MVTVIDYKAGNAPSVMHALRRIGVEGRLAKDRAGLRDASHIILPGVGSAAATMDSLRELDLIDLLREKVIREKIPFLGICVGLQVLFEHSEEGDVDCLGWIPGQVKRFSAEKVRVPQMGWNRVHFTKKHPIIEGIPDGSYFYFVNSYYAVPEHDDHRLGITDYGHPFCSMVAHENIFATQFHTEKSGEVGLKILKQFTELER